MALSSLSAVVSLLVTLCSVVMARVPLKLETDGIRWSYQKIRALNSTLSSVYEGLNSAFTYYDAALAARMPNFVPPFQLITVAKPSDICWRNNIQGRYRYFSGDILESSLSQQFSHRQLDSIFRDNKLPDESMLNIWIGEQGIIATPHYDSVHNVFWQLAGRKVIRIKHPVNAASMMLHGRLHPFACQSRYGSMDQQQPISCSLYSLSRRHMCESCSEDISSTIADQSDPVTGVIEVVLNPGDVIYLPPFWLHETEVLDECSVSLSLWWDPKERQSLQELLQYPLPIESDWTTEKSLSVTVHYLQSFLKILQDHLLLPSQYMYKLLQARYWEDLVQDRSSLIALDLVPLDSVDPSALKKAESYGEKAALDLMRKVAASAGDDQWEQWSAVRGEDIVNSQCNTGDAAEHSCSSGDQYTSAVVALKAAEYVEEVAMYIASVLVDSERHSEGAGTELEEQTIYAISILDHVLHGLE